MVDLISLKAGRKFCSHCDLNDILHFFGQGNLFLSGKSQEILKTDIRGNHEHYY